MTCKSHIDPQAGADLNVNCIECEEEQLLHYKAQIMENAIKILIIRALQGGSQKHSYTSLHLTDMEMLYCTCH